MSKYTIKKLTANSQQLMAQRIKCQWLIATALLFTLQFSLFTRSALAQSVDSDPLVKAIKEELKYNMDQLKNEPVPPYFMAFRVNDDFSVVVQSLFGESTTTENRTKQLTPQVRIGSLELDNYKYQNQSRAGIWTIPFNDESLMAVRQGIWQKTLQSYKNAKANYDAALSKMQTNADNEDKAPCFAPADVVTYYEAPLPKSDYDFDKEGWAKRLDEVSKVFKDCRELQVGYALIDYQVQREYVVTSEGSVVVQNRKSARVMLYAAIQAADGMTCPLYKDFFAFDLKDLPGNDVLIETAKNLVSRLLELRDAPIADPYAGPAILSGSSSGVFFHEIFGHRLEAHRMKSGGQTFKKLVGQAVLPSEFHVYSDPTLTQYRGTDLNGYYLYDDEGVKAQRVENVENGVLTHFLLDRTPIDGFPRSNGHGRAAPGMDPVSRQSNLVIETSKPYTEAELRKMLIDEAKKQGKEYGYYFRTATSGLTYLGDAGSINSFNVDPIEVYKVYVDGRPDQLVRGVKLIGTPLSMFSNIAAAGENPVVFTGMCGAESGQIPVTAISPEIFVTKIETQRTGTGFQLPKILPLPEFVDMPKDEVKTITKALEDDVKSSLESLHTEGQPRPFYIDNAVQFGHQFSITSELGGITARTDDPANYYLSSYLVVGDSLCINNANTAQTRLTGHISYDMIRRLFWEIDDNMYKQGINSYAQNRNRMNANPLPEEDAGIPVRFHFHAGEYVSKDEPVNHDLNRAELENLADHLSAIFLEYPQLYNTSVRFTSEGTDIHRITSDGVKVHSPYSMTSLIVSAEVKCEDGSVTHKNLSYNVRSHFDIPSKEKLEKDVREFADLLISLSKAKSIKEYYSGPIMFEGVMAQNELFNIANGIGVASRNPFTGSSNNSMMLGKRVLDTRFSIHALSDLPAYKGTKLFGNFTMDAYGQVPAKDFTIVEKGILKNLICGDKPAIGAMRPTGNTIANGAGTFTGFGILHVAYEKTVPYSKMRKLLKDEAKKAGLDHAYIVKSMGDVMYLVRYDINTGEEEIVNMNGLPMLQRRDLMHLTAVSSEEGVFNKQTNGNLTSIIAPQAFIVENMEVNFTKPRREEDFVLKNPALR